MYKELKPGKTYAYIMAGVLTVNILLCFALYGLFLLILIGAWHVIDALVFVFTGDRRRMPYLYALAAYAVLGSALAYADVFNSTAFIILFLFVISHLLGFWYCYITYQHAMEDTVPVGEDREDILDSF